MIDNEAEIIIIGGGVSGLSMACLLASQDKSVICIDMDNPYNHIDAGYDGRALAISWGSHHILKAAGVWDKLSNKKCPINDIKIKDGDSPVLLSFINDNSDKESFGWIIEIQNLRKALIKRVSELPKIKHIAPAKVKDFRILEDKAYVICENGDEYSAKLIIGADGRTSFTRNWLGIDEHHWKYNQNALVFTVEHENKHNNVAYENFEANGPFAILPMEDSINGKHRSAVVWTEHGNKKSAKNYSKDIFNIALKARFPDEYGDVKLASKIWSYPLSLIHAHKYYGQRMVLISDAAHGIHPVAGQGLNLGFRDIAALAKLISEYDDIGDIAMLEQYQKMRHFDNMVMAATCDGLVRLFSNDFTPIRLARKAGIKLVDKLPFARNFFARQAMGLSSNN